MQPYWMPPIPGLIASTSTITTIITDGASMDFPLQDQPAAIIFRVLFIYFLKTASSNLETRFNKSVCEIGVSLVCTRFLPSYSRIILFC